ncbi:MAG: hypothetical protein FJ225_06060 [Lentisphaerae bacterium]|nr:hypothetical protein [Lentisphaerota bacterium]
MKARRGREIKRWLACGGAAIASLGATVAQAQVQIEGVKQPRLSPPACHAHFKNIAIVPRDEKSAIIRFDMDWSGAWRHDVNHSAVWVFFKARLDGQTEWKPVRLVADPPSPAGSGAASKDLNPAGYGQESGPRLDFIVPNDESGPVGIFVRLADHGMGDVEATGMTAIWDLTATPEIKKDTKVAIKAYGLKMVYVAEGSYYLGTGGDETGAFHQYQAEKKQAAEKERISDGNATMVVRESADRAADFPPYHVTSSAAIPTGREPGKLWARGAEPEEGGEIPAAFPNGYNAFYIMERPIPQAAYAYFLSSLPSELAASQHHEGNHATEAGWAGEIKKVENDDDNPYQFFHGRLKTTCTWWLRWENGASFAAWAGLRPMTELENEKALRGPRLPVVNEAGHSFWGGSYGGGRYNAHPREMLVTVATPSGRAFKGTHGTGSATDWPADWPRKDAVGTGVRNAQEAACGIDEIKGPFWCTSCRIGSDLNDPERNKIYGFRGARTAPEEAKWNTVRNEEESSPVLAGLPASRE